MNEGIKINCALVKAIIRRKNCTVREFAIKNGIGCASLSNWITGKVNPKERNVAILALALGVPVDCLYLHGEFFEVWKSIQRMSPEDIDLLSRQIAIFKRMNDG